MEMAEAYLKDKKRVIPCAALCEGEFGVDGFFIGVPTVIGSGGIEKIVEFNMDNVITFREQYNTIPNTKISFNDIIVKACAMALKKHPEVNSVWHEDQISHNYHIHIGVAVAVGLVVGVAGRLRGRAADS